jgi:hypothetical protein
LIRHFQGLEKFTKKPNFATFTNRALMAKRARRMHSQQHKESWPRCGIGQQAHYCRALMSVVHGQVRRRHRNSQSPHYPPVGYYACSKIATRSAHYYFPWGFHVCSKIATHSAHYNFPWGFYVCSKTATRSAHYGCQMLRACEYRRKYPS